MYLGSYHTIVIIVGQKSFGDTGGIPDFFLNFIWLRDFRFVFGGSFLLKIANLFFFFFLFFSAFVFVFFLGLPRFPFTSCRVVLSSSWHRMWVSGRCLH